MSKRPIITLFTDMGMWPKEKIATWAYYAYIGSKTRVEGGGRLKEYPTGTDFGELRSGVNAIHSLKNHLGTLKGYHIVWQTDSLGAINHFKAGKLLEVRVAIELLQSEGGSLSCKHVKGHVDKDHPDYTGRNWVNNYVDELCRKYKREA